MQSGRIWKLERSYEYSKLQKNRTEHYVNIAVYETTLVKSIEFYKIFFAQNRLNSFVKVIRKIIVMNIQSDISIDDSQ